MLALALVACGDEGSSSGSDSGDEEFTTPEPSAEAFVAEANEICAGTERAAEQETEAIEEAGLHSPESAGHLRRAAATQAQGLKKLRALNPPEEDAGDYQEFIRSYEVNVVKLEAVAAAIESGDTEEAQRIEEDINASTEELTDPLAAELGIDDCASG